MDPNEEIVYRDSGTFATDSQLTYSVNPPPTAITFSSGEDRFELSWKDGVLHYEGKLDEGAKELFQVLKPFIDKYIKDNAPYNNLDYLAWKHERNSK